MKVLLLLLVLMCNKNGSRFLPYGIGDTDVKDARASTLPEVVGEDITSGLRVSGVGLCSPMGRLGRSVGLIVALLWQTGMDWGFICHHGCGQGIGAKGVPLLCQIAVAQEDETTLLAGERVFNGELCTTAVTTMRETAGQLPVAQPKVVTKLIGR